MPSDVAIAPPGPQGGRQSAAPGGAAGAPPPLRRTIVPDVPPAHLRVTPQAAFGLLMAVVMAVTLSTAIIPGWSRMVELFGKDTMRVILAMLIALMMTAVPVCLCLVQGIARGRHLEVLDSLLGTPLGRTEAYRYAYRHMVAVQPTNIGFDYVLPMLAFAVVVMFGSVAVNCAFLVDFYFEGANPMLGALTAANEQAAAHAYQRGTFVAGAYSFLGAYVYVMYRLLQRLNTDDITPIIFYRYAAHFVIAYIVATTLRHGAEAVGLDSANWLVPLSFVVGLSPDLFVSVLSSRVFAQLKIFGQREDPGSAHLPRAMPLLMIDELKQAQIDRLAELGITSAQDLAKCNPFLLEPRVPYELMQIVCWIAQAQLYVLVREGALAALRAQAVPDILALHQRLLDPAARGQACAALGIDPAAGEALLRQLEQDPAFVQLREVRDAMMLPHPRTPAGPALAA
ncbi:hypothetical protein [Paracraurococcus ruber]|uniref:Uncharacterized protein n=1 Tax=Paracraurococcus ruber TaxID=77675 RepID=A0ABS1CU48_9PROT|nr:hypothetical protein [Paracraurococcus ruber]MBK1657726.1 hypothetical protein [Paracraurococcus ruber]TDG31537.1 hypothetical protein E2C05_10455 [Paracraurococcus ruber]